MSGNFLFSRHDGSMIIFWVDAFPWALSLFNGVISLADRHRDAAPSRYVLACRRRGDAEGANRALPEATLASRRAFDRMPTLMQNAGLIEIVEAPFTRRAPADEGKGLLESPLLSRRPLQSALLFRGGRRPFIR